MNMFVKINLKDLNFKMKEKGISTLVATILLVLITIVAIGLIWGAILPLIQKGLGQSKACGLTTTLKIDKEQGYTCYNGSEKSVIVMIEKPHDAEFNLVGINVQVSGGGRKKVYTLRETSMKNVWFLNESGQWDNNIKLPKSPGEALTYKINASFEVTEVGVAPIVLYGKSEYTCNLVTEHIEPCST